MANLVDFTVGRQRRVARSTFSAELKGLVDSVEQLFLLQIVLHQIYCGTHQSPEEMIDMFEHWCLYPQLDIAVDARAVYDVVAATGACDPQECPLKLHLISARDRLAQGIIRRTHWAGSRDMLAEGLIKVGGARFLLHKASNDCNFKLAHIALTHAMISVSLATTDSCNAGA